MLFDIFLKLLVQTEQISLLIFDRQDDDYIRVNGLTVSRNLPCLLTPVHDAFSSVRDAISSV